MVGKAITALKDSLLCQLWRSEEQPTFWELSVNKAIAKKPKPKDNCEKQDESYGLQLAIAKVDVMRESEYYCS